MATTCKLIAKVSLGSDAANIEFTSIPGTYTDLLIAYSLRSTRSAVVDVVQIRFNGAANDTNLSSRYLRGDGANATSAAPAAGYAGLVSGDTATASTFGSGEIYIPNYAGSTNKSWSSVGVSETNSTTAYIEAEAGLWSSTNAITAVNILPSNGPNWKSGSSAFLYGIKKS